MQDLDFDELDKAVNSLMPKSKSASDDSLTPSSSSAPVTSTDGPITAPIAPVTVVSTPPALNTVERPSTGRFMDVVHPSSNMRANINLPQRQASTAQTPRSDDNKPVAPIISAPQYSPPVTSTTQPPAINNWAGLSGYQEPNEVPESPFLPEAKVEKRPLGAFSDEAVSSTAIGETKSEQINALDDQTIEKTKPVETVDLSKSLPDELDDSLLNVESSSSTHSNAAELAVNPLSKLSNDSINQQYTEKPTSTIKDSTSIYDTSSYNKAVVSKPKKKSGWLMVLWIVLLLIAGVGAGVGFYYFIAPNLLNVKLPF
ncbi:MAG: hypothetical protein WCQ49_02150 [Candidatus Saccharibacteria bacterium]